MAPNVKQHECSTELLSLQYDFKFAVAQLLFRRDIPFRLIGTFVPNHNGTRTVMTLRDHTFEVSVLDRVILGHRREPFGRWIQARPFGDLPRK